MTVTKEDAGKYWMMKYEMLKDELSDIDEALGLTHAHKEASGENALDAIADLKKKLRQKGIVY